MGDVARLASLPVAMIYGSIFLLMAVDDARRNGQTPALVITVVALCAAALWLA